MFNLKVKFLLAVSILAVGGVTAANAQLSKGSVIKANISKEFVVSGKSFPAGSYTIERLPGMNDSGSLLVLRGNDKSMIFDTIESQSGETAKTTALVFDDVDGVEYLSKILVSGDNVAIEIPRTPVETKSEVLTPAEANIVLVQNPGY